MNNTVNLKKGEVVNLSKHYESVSLNKNTSLNKLHVGLGWDVVTTFGYGGADLDAFVLQLDATGVVLDTVYFGSLKSEDGAIKHTGDNLTGEGDGDDEVIHINLSKLNPKTHALIIAVNIYSANIPFSQVENAFIRIADTNGRKENQLVHYSLSADKGKNFAMLAGVLRKSHDGSWEFEAVGQFTKDKNISSFRSNVHSYLESTTPFPQVNDLEENTSTPKKGFFRRLFS